MVRGGRVLGGGGRGGCWTIRRSFSLLEWAMSLMRCCHGDDSPCIRLSRELSCCENAGDSAKKYSRRCARWLYVGGLSRRVMGCGTHAGVSRWEGFHEDDFCNCRP